MDGKVPRLLRGEASQAGLRFGSFASCETCTVTGSQRYFPPLRPQISTARQVSRVLPSGHNLPRFCALHTGLSGSCAKHPPSTTIVTNMHLKPTTTWSGDPPCIAIPSGTGTLVGNSGWSRWSSPTRSAFRI